MNNNFKIGETVVCVSNNIIPDSIGEYDTEFHNALLYLKKGKKYKIIDIKTSGIGKLVKIIEKLDFYFDEDRFISLKEYRKLKLNKIFKDDNIDVGMIENINKKL
jgi:hypothetical protein